MSKSSFIDFQMTEKCRKLADEYAEIYKISVASEAVIGKFILLMRDFSQIKIKCTESLSASVNCVWLFR